VRGKSCINSVPENEKNVMEVEDISELVFVKLVEKVATCQEEERVVRGS